MEVYLDYIFFENLLVNFFVSIQIPIFCKFKINICRCLIGAAIASTYSIFVYTNLNYMSQNQILRFAIIFLCVYILYNPKTIKLYIKYFLIYLLFFLINSSIIIFFTVFLKLNLERYIIKILLYLLSGVLLTISNKFLWKMWKNNIKESIIFEINIDNIKIFGFVDTGNSVKDVYSGLDVLFISDEYEERLLKNKKLDKREIKISTAVSSKKLDGYIFKDVYISDKKVRIKFEEIVLIFIEKGIFKNKKYEGLISYDTYVEKLKGVTL